MAETQTSVSMGRAVAVQVTPRVLTNTGIHTAVELIGPERARQMLLKLNNPRPLSQATVDNYVDVMRRKDWAFNGDPIRFNEDGALIDGQHRLQAIIKSGVAQKMLVIHGLGDDTFETIDVGKKRSHGDLLAICGHTDGVMLGAMARGLIIYESGVYWASEAARKLDYHPTGKQILKYVSDNPDVAENAKLIRNKYSYAVRLCGPSPLGMAFTLARRESEKKAAEFIDGISGDVSGMTRTDARWVVRDYLTKQKLDRARRIDSRYAQAVLINAANLYFGGLEASSNLIRWQPEKQWFPKFDGGKSQSRALARRDRVRARGDK